MISKLRRRWTLSPLHRLVCDGPTTPRATTKSDDDRIAALLADSYVGSLDDDTTADYTQELWTWRRIDDADDEASTVAHVDAKLVGVSLIARELDTPLLYEIAVTHAHRRSGIARALLTRSIHVLRERGEEALSAWVTTGNAASESLLMSFGFVPVTPSIGRGTAIAYYRAAASLRDFDRAGVRAVGASVDEGVPTLSVVRDRDVGVRVSEAGDVTVKVEFIAPSDPRVGEVADRVMPIIGAAWFFSRRTARAFKSR